MVISISKAAVRSAISAFLFLQAFSAAKAATPVLTTVASFTGPNGSHSVSGLTLGKNGLLYGTTFDGGTYGYGTVFQLTPGTSGAFTLATLYNFTGYADGGSPVAGVIVAPGGLLYGTTEFGGSLGDGAVYELTPPTTTGGAWTESVLYSFQGGNDGAFPYAGLARGVGGNLYGCTFNGGPTGNGTVFEVIPGKGGNPSAETVLYAFQGNADGGNPEGTLLIEKGGALFGTAFGGNLGDVFELTPPAIQGGLWTKSIIHAFLGGSDGSNPQAGLVPGAGGALYGTTYLGGTAGTTGHGTVYQLTPPAAEGGPWTETVLHGFDLGDGLYAEGPVTIGLKGVLYGTTNSGGTEGAESQGTVYQLSPPTVAGGPWTESVLVTFTGPNGQAPDSGMVFDHTTLYGTTRYGGSTANMGIVFGLAP